MHFALPSPTTARPVLAAPANKPLPLEFPTLTDRFAMDHHSRLAVLSGIFGSIGSLFGKLSGLPSLQDYLMLRIASFGLMLIFNTGSMTSYVKALQGNSSLRATVISTAGNYFCSAMIGFVCFHEVTTLLWWSGTILVLMGLVLITAEQTDSDIGTASKVQIKNQ